MSETNKSQHILILAETIIEDIESERISSESLVLKASRLANLAGSERIQKWLTYEKYGYNNTEPLSLEYLSLTHRIIKPQYKYIKSSPTIYYGSLASQEKTVENYKLRLENLKHNPEPKNNSANQTGYQPPSLDKTIIDFIGYHQSIINKVKALIHNFATTVYYERLFSDISENIFESFKLEVDTLLATNCGDVLQRIPSIYKRLNEGDKEAISQALTTCRRIIESFADVIYPPTDVPITINNQPVNLSSKHHLNRINAYIRERLTSDSRRTKFRQSLGNLYDRLCAGVHNDVTLNEARSLFLETYILMGEILTLKK